MPLVSITYANLKPALNQNKELETETKNWKHFKNDLTRDKKLSWKAKYKGSGKGKGRGRRVLKRKGIAKWDVRKSHMFIIKHEQGIDRAANWLPMLPGLSASHGGLGLN